MICNAYHGFHYLCVTFSLRSLLYVCNDKLIIIISVKVAEWPPSGKELFALFTVRTLCNLPI